MCASMTASNSHWILPVRGFAFTQHLLGVPSRAVRRNPAWHYVLTDASARAILADTTSEALWKSIAKDLIDVRLPDVVVVLGEGGSNASCERYQMLQNGCGRATYSRDA